MTSKSRKRLGLLLFLAALAGCVESNPNKPPEPVQEIDHIDLFTGSVAVNLDATPGLDGVVANVYTFRVNQPTEQLVSGEMDLLMYAHEGPIASDTLENLLSEPPFRQWTYGPRDLKRHRLRTEVGLWGYRFALNWGPKPPPTKRVLVLVRYRSPSGKVLYSKPNHVALRNQ